MEFERLFGSDEYLQYIKYVYKTHRISNADLYTETNMEPFWQTIQRIK